MGDTWKATNQPLNCSPFTTGPASQVGRLEQIISSKVTLFQYFLIGGIRMRRCIRSCTQNLITRNRNCAFTLNRSRGIHPESGWLAERRSGLHAPIASMPPGSKRPKRHGQISSCAGFAPRGPWQTPAAGHRRRRVIFLQLCDATISLNSTHIDTRASQFNTR